jgi:spermidine synthase
LPGYRPGFSFGKNVVVIERSPAFILQDTPAGTTAGSALALLLMFASGAAGLVWQMAWTAQLGVALGHEMISVLSVMAAFFGGLACGGFLLAATIERSTSPGRWYAFLEALVGVWGLLVTLGSTVILSHVSAYIGAEPSTTRHWTIAFFVPFVLLFPATLAMGAALPAMERLLRSVSQGRLEHLYAANTAGAMLGLLLAVFFLIPELGLRRTGLLFAGVNLSCALAAWYTWGRRTTAISNLSRTPVERSVTATITSRLTARAPIAARLLFSGLLGIGYEVLAIRVLAQITENTVYTYALLLANFLFGTAAGAVLIRSAGHSDEISALRTDRSIDVLVASMILGGISLWWAPEIHALPAKWFGAGPATALMGEWAAGAAAMILPAMAMGALFTLLCRRAQQVGMPLGVAIGFNTLGCALAPLLVGLFLLPNSGARLVLLLLLSGYLAMRTFSSWRKPVGWAPAAIVLSLALFSAPLRFIDIPAAGRLLSYRDGVMASVSVVEDEQGVARLHINNRVQEGSSANGVIETRLAQLPLLLHDNPRQALFLGYGTGFTANVAGLDPNVNVKAVELLPEVIDAASIFASRAVTSPASHPVKIVAADARRYVQATPERYDVIVADLFHPARNGAGSLYTVEHFLAIRSRLRSGGLFCQWLALHQMDLETLRSIVASFLLAYPNGVAVLASNSLDTPVLGLISRPGSSAWNTDAVRARLAGAPPAVALALRQADIDDVFAVLGSVVAGPEVLRAFAQGAVLNTDDRPVVAHRAPWITYSPMEPARDRLAMLMRQLTPQLREVVDDSHSPDAARLRSYWKARSDYLAIGMTVKLNPDPKVMLERLQGPLLEIVTTSPDFRPASKPLMTLSRAVRMSDPAKSAQVETALRYALSSQPTSRIP